MLRRLGTTLFAAALVLLALPGAAAPVAAHTSGGLTTAFDIRTDAAGDLHVNGTVTNHTASRRTGISISVTFSGSTGPIHVDQAGPFVTNLAPHATSPFELFVDKDDVTGYTSVSASATGSPTNVKPAGGIHVEAGALVGDVLTASVTNDSAVTAQQLVVYAVRRSGGEVTDVGGSTTVASLGPTASTEVTVTFDPESVGETVTGLVAMTKAGMFLTSWNNFFGDLGSSIFMTEIAWMADEGITTGCGAALYCPKAGLSREQMAVFLVRALDLPPAFEDYFTDDETSFAEAEINALRQAGLTTGCTTMTFCPKQTVTREQMAAFLDRAFEYPAATEDFFTDDETSFAEAEINDLAAAGITTGCTVTTFCPKQTVTREQMAAFFYRSMATDD